MYDTGRSGYYYCAYVMCYVLCVMCYVLCVMCYVLCEETTENKKGVQRRGWSLNELPIQVKSNENEEYLYVHTYIHTYIHR